MGDEMVIFQNIIVKLSVTVLNGYENWNFTKIKKFAFSKIQKQDNAHLYL